MIPKEQIESGLKVHYTPAYGNKENGIVKSLNRLGDGAFVVYHCAGDWKNYQDYTGALTDLEDLTLGWVEHQKI